MISDLRSNRHTWSHGDMDEGADGQPTTYDAVNMDLQLNAVRCGIMLIVVNPASTGVYPRPSTGGGG